MKQNRNYILSAMLLVLFSAACGKKKTNELPAPIAPAQEAVVQPTPEQPKEKPVYVYSGDRFRDPFTPSGTSSSYQPDAVFDPQRAAVRGIIFGQKYQSAVLNVTGGGTYFVNQGRIFDIMGKTIEGYKAKIFKDKVTVIGDSDTVYELKMQNANGEEEKSL